MRNIELKAKLPDFERALAACRTLGAQFQGDIHQIDTYFDVPNGRLKLREANPGRTELVHYHRPDVAGAKGCDYTLEAVNPTIKAMLAEALGTLTVVDKVRTLYLWENVRIHLDRVAGLGDFLEFEAVQPDGAPDEDGFKKLTFLSDQFTIGEHDYLTHSYLDMQLAASCAHFQ
ncbi:MAG: class IV adenylate cyclase [Candidatus Hydrogenedentes bacterium]|nr:class IV adenylate cyclase [Candidatus Hydrogenedentota bacterium]